MKLFALGIGVAAMVFTAAQARAAGGLDVIGEHLNSYNPAVAPYGIAGAVSIAVSPDGAHAYAASDGLLCDPGGVAVFSRNAATGALTFVESHCDFVPGGPCDRCDMIVDRLAAAKSVAISGDGGHVYVVTHVGARIVALRRDPTTGSLTFVEALGPGDTDHQGNAVGGLCAPQSITVSPDPVGAHVYVADQCNEGQHDGRVVVFRRETNSGSADYGKLSFVEAHVDGTNGVDGVADPQSVAVAPDGRHVYIADYLGDGVAVFSRNVTAGALAFVAVETGEPLDLACGLPGLSLLDRVQAVTVSPDNLHVYASAGGADGVGDGRVAAFDRNLGTGRLTFSQQLCGSDDTARDKGVVVSPDGTNVYLPTRNNHWLSVFRRDPLSGQLALVEKQTHGTCHAGKVSQSCSTDADCDTLPASGDGRCIESLVQVDSVAVSSDGAHVYAASYFSSSVTSFRRVARCNAGSPDPNCRQAQGSGLDLRHGNDDSGDRLFWRWARGASTSRPEFGDPRSTTSYAFCVYAGPAADLVLEARVPSDSAKWRAVSDRGFDYRDRDRVESGIAVIVMRESARNRARAMVRGMGTGLPDPVLGSLPSPVTAQLVNSQTGVCLEATFQAEEIFRNTPERFRARR